MKPRRSSKPSLYALKVDHANETRRRDDILQTLFKKLVYNLFGSKIEISSLMA